MKKLEYKNFEIKGLDYNSENGELIVNGYASIFNTEDTLNPSWNNELKQYVLAKDIIHNGAFSKTISERKNRIKVCKNHNLENPIGKPIEIKEDELGLFTSTRISDAEDDLKIKIREGIFNEMSIGYVVVKCEFKALSDGTYIRDIWEVQLFEYSIVTLGRHEDAKITELKDISNANDILEKIIETEKNEEKKYQLLQLQSLISGEPSKSLIQEEPIKKESKCIDFDKINFKN